MKRLRKIMLFSFAFVLGLVTFVGFNAKADEPSGLDCGANTAINVVIDWNGPADPNIEVAVCPGEVMSEVPEAPVYQGYTFDKFTHNGEEINLAENTDWGTEPTFEVQANWIGNNIDITFVYPNSDPAATETKKVGEELDLSSFNNAAIAAAEEGKVFIGWSYSIDNGEEAIPSSVEIFVVPAIDQNSLELTAQYANQFAITFNLNGGNVAGSTDPVVVNVIENAVIPTESIPAVVAPEGQELKGWFDAATDGTKVDLATATFSEATEVFAQYKDAEEPVNPPAEAQVSIELPEGVAWAEGVTWNPNFTVGAVITLPLAKDVVISDVNKELEGWKEVANARSVGEVLAPGAEYTVTSTAVTFEAMLKDKDNGGNGGETTTPWKATISYVVTPGSFKDPADFAAAKYEPGTKITLPKASDVNAPEGKKLVGWEIFGYNERTLTNNGAGPGSVLAPGFEYTVVSYNVEFVAQYESDVNSTLPDSGSDTVVMAVVALIAGSGLMVVRKLRA